MLRCEKIVAERARSGDNQDAGIGRQDGAGPLRWGMIFSEDRYPLFGITL
jgi:hypothetical protein